MDVLIVVPAELLLLFKRKASHGLLDIAIGVLAADHEADLARGISGYGRVGVFDCWEDLFAVLLELGD